MPAGTRGDVWLVDLGMVAKVRPALVLSVSAGDADRALVTLVPHTTAVRGSSYEVALSVPGLDSGAFDAQNLVTISQAKLLRRLTTLTADQLAAIEGAVRNWPGLS